MCLVLVQCGPCSNTAYGLLVGVQASCIASRWGALQLLQSGGLSSKVTGPQAPTVCAVSAVCVLLRQHGDRPCDIWAGCSNVSPLGLLVIEVVFVVS